jgi:hypothetical protein
LLTVWRRTFEKGWRFKELILLTASVSPLFFPRLTFGQQTGEPPPKRTVIFDAKATHLLFEPPLRSNSNSARQPFLTQIDCLLCPQFTPSTHLVSLSCLTIRTLPRMFNISRNGTDLDKILGEILEG